MPKRIVIVGAGPGGLSSALLLAGSGYDVTVLERLPYVGGRTSSITERGFRWDRGPTFFLYPRVLEEILSSVGLRLDEEIPMTRLDPQYRLQFGAGQLDSGEVLLRTQQEHPLRGGRPRLVGCVIAPPGFAHAPPSARRTSA